MKKPYLLIAMLATIFFHQKVVAQLPESSTETNPVWYYLQVEGENERMDLVFTAVDNVLYGKKQIISADMSQVATQLWRFEQHAGGYTIINKLENRSLFVAYDISSGINYCTLSENSATFFDIVPYESGYQIVAKSIPQGAIQNDIYLHQANDGGNRNYRIMLVSTTWANDPNSTYSFILFHDFEIEYSDSDKDVWYNLASAKPGIENKCITDIVTESTGVNLAIVPIQAENKSQQWKVVKKSATIDDNRIDFINRETGNVIHTYSDYRPNYNLPRVTQDRNESNGWTPVYLGGGQYMLFGVEEDLITRYLNATVIDEQPEEWSEKSNMDTGFAWYFKKVENSSDINELLMDNIQVYSTNGRIVVSGTDNYSIYSIVGMHMDKSQNLPQGIYLVNVNGKIIKIFVK